MTEVDVWPLFAHVKNFNSYDAVLCIVVDDDARPNLFRARYFRFAELDISGVYLGIVFQLHNLPFMRRSKKAEITRTGAVVVFYTTRRMRLSIAAIRFSAWLAVGSIASCS